MVPPPPHPKKKKKKPDLHFLYGRRDWDPTAEESRRPLTEEEKASVYPKPFFTAERTVEYFGRVFNLTL